MTKREERERDGSTWQSTQDDEPVFIVCARDVLAPHTVMDWADRAAKLGVNDEKVRAAIGLANEMIAWQRKHGMKLPD